LKYVFSLIAAIILFPILYYLPIKGSLPYKMGIVCSALILALIGHLAYPLTWLVGLEICILAACLAYFNLKLHWRSAEKQVDAYLSEDDLNSTEEMEILPKHLTDVISEPIVYQDLQAAAFDEGISEQSLDLVKPETGIEEREPQDEVQEDITHSLEIVIEDISHLPPLQSPEAAKVPSEELTPKEEPLDFLVDEENWQQIRSQWNTNENDEQDQGNLDEVALQQREWLLEDVSMELEADTSDYMLQENEVTTVEALVLDDFSEVVDNLGETASEPIALDLEEMIIVEEEHNAVPNERFFSIIGEQLDWIRRHASGKAYEQAVIDYITTDLPECEYYMLVCKLRDHYLETAQFDKLKSLLQEMKNRFYQVDYIILEIDYYWRKTSSTVN
jgi:hypothetical protein